jgi:hypothetical protein
LRHVGVAETSLYPIKLVTLGVPDTENPEPPEIHLNFAFTESYARTWSALGVAPDYVCMSPTVIKLPADFTLDQ